MRFASSSNNLSKTVFQAHQMALLKKRQNSIVNMSGKDSGEDVAQNMITAIRNVLYYNFRNLVGRDINKMVGTEQQYDIDELIKLLMIKGNKLYTTVSGKQVDIKMNISKGGK